MKSGLTGVTNSGDVLDDDNVIRVLAGLVDLASLLSEVGGSLEEDRIGSDHVVDDRRFGNLLRSELPLRAEILAVIVAQVVVGRDRERLNTGIDEELGKDRLDFGLT